MENKIFLGGFEQANVDTFAITYMNFFPFDAEAGLGKTEEELNEIGIVINKEDMPTTEVQEGKEPHLFYNSTSKLLYFTYVPIRISTEELLRRTIANQELIKLALDELIMGGM